MNLNKTLSMFRKYTTTFLTLMPFFRFSDWNTERCYLMESSGADLLMVITRME